jgi:hypothetical protein
MNFLMNLTSLLMVTGRLHQEQEMGARTERIEKRGARQGEPPGGAGVQSRPLVSEKDNAGGAGQRPG